MRATPGLMLAICTATVILYCARAASLSPFELDVMRMGDYDHDYNGYPRIRNARAADTARSMGMVEAAANPVYIISPWEMPDLWRKEFGMEKRGGARARSLGRLVKRGHEWGPRSRSLGRMVKRDPEEEGNFDNAAAYLTPPGLEFWNYWNYF